MLQCLIASPKLSQYFREGLHAREVNKSTKTKGQIAVLFADLVSKANSGKPEEESPQELKDLICKAAAFVCGCALTPFAAQIYPEFEGYDEQDAHEFLSVFLDALSRDLNRIKKKPQYSELKVNAKDSIEEQVGSARGFCGWRPSHPVRHCPPSRRSEANRWAPTPSRSCLPRRNPCRILS